MVQTLQGARFTTRSARNAEISPAEMDPWIRLDRGGERLLRHVARQHYLSARGIHRVLRVTRTIVDLDERAETCGDDVAEVLSYRGEVILPSSSF